jgi:SPP1 gp7 family putative phage head morphogenesis protein
MATANTHIQDEITARDVELERYKRGVIVRVLNLLARLEEDLVKRMASLDPTEVAPRYKQARLTRLLAEMATLVDTYGAALEQDVLPDLTQLAKDEAAFGVRMFNGVIPVAVETVVPAAVTLQAAVMSRPFQGKLLKEWVRDHAPAVRMRLRGVIRQGVAEGQTIDQMVRAVRGTAASQYTDGVMAINRRGAEAMVRTAVQHTVSSAREITYEANADLIKGVRMVATLDGRTTLFCMAIDGKVFPQGKGPRPPFHVSCRTSSVPVLKSWKEMGIDLKEAPEGTRASMDGQVAAETTYNSWLRGRPAAFQDDVLGATKGALYRRGGLSIDKFVDNSGKAYSLDELRRREPAAFEKAKV